MMSAGVPLPIALVVLGLVVLVLVVAWRIDRKQRRATITMRTWTDDIQTMIRRHTEACLLKAECEIEVASLVEHAPKEFVGPVIEAMRMGYAAERAAWKRAKDRGLITEERYDFGEPHAEQRPAPIKLEEDASPQTPTTWQGGRQVPALHVVRRRKAGSDT